MKFMGKHPKFSKFKYHNIIYNIGDCLCIQAKEKNKYLYAKLLEILPSNGMKKHSLWPSIKVQWYYLKSDLNREKNGLIDPKAYDSISEFELFESPHNDIIYIESVICKCYTLKYEDYINLDESEDTMFFTRAKYNPYKELLDPPFETWERICKCKMPFNPDKLYITCDGCQKSFHPECFNIKEDEIEKIDFYCDECKNKNLIN